MYGSAVPIRHVRICRGRRNRDSGLHAAAGDHLLRTEIIQTDDSAPFLWILALSGSHQRGGRALASPLRLLFLSWYMHGIHSRAKERNEAAGWLSGMSLIKARHRLAGCGGTVPPSQLPSPRPANHLLPGLAGKLLARDARLNQPRGLLPRLLQHGGLCVSWDRVGSTRSPAVARSLAVIDDNSNNDNLTL